MSEMADHRKSHSRLKLPRIPLMSVPTRYADTIWNIDVLCWHPLHCVWCLVVAFYVQWWWNVYVVEVFQCHSRIKRPLGIHSGALKACCASCAECADLCCFIYAQPMLRALIRHAQYMSCTHTHTHMHPPPTHVHHSTLDHLIGNVVNSTLPQVCRTRNQTLG